MNSDKNNLSAFQCQRSRSIVQQGGATLFNQIGEAIGEVRGDIVYFSSASSAEDASVQTQLDDLNQYAREEGWRAALTKIYDAQLIRYVTDVSRAIFIDLLPINKESVVLEIGPGLGQFTPILAARAGFVHALEVVEGQAHFSAQRVNQEGHFNVQITAGGSDCRFPYADQFFDLVVINLVFEWCAARLSEDSHVAAQSRLLAETYRVLKPDGALYLATKNRFALKYLIGKPDEHFDGMRFGSALPRWLSRALFGRRQPGLLHSYGALKAMLERAEFSVVQSWWAAPEVRFPTHLVPTDSASVRAARQDSEFVQGLSRSDRLLMPLIPAPLVKYFTPGLIFLANKPRQVEE